MKFPREYSRKNKNGDRERKREMREKRAFDRARMRSRATVNLKTFDDTRLYFRGCFETHRKHILIFCFLPFFHRSPPLLFYPSRFQS